MTCSCCSKSWLAALLNTSYSTSSGIRPFIFPLWARSMQERRIGSQHPPCLRQTASASKDSMRTYLLNHGRNQQRKGHPCPQPAVWAMEDRALGFRVTHQRIAVKHTHALFEWPKGFARYVHKIALAAYLWSYADYSFVCVWSSKSTSPVSFWFWRSTKLIVSDYAGVICFATTSRQTSIVRRITGALEFLDLWWSQVDMLCP